MLFFSPDQRNLYVIPDLLPKTYYMIRARALNLAGSSDSSNIIILQTNSEEAVGELTFSAGQPTSTSTLTLTLLTSLMTTVSLLRR